MLLLLCVVKMWRRSRTDKLALRITLKNEKKRMIWNRAFNINAVPFYVFKPFNNVFMQKENYKLVVCLIFIRRRYFNKANFTSIIANCALKEITNSFSTLSLLLIEKCFVLNAHRFNLLALPLDQQIHHTGSQILLDESLLKILFVSI